MLKTSFALTALVAKKKQKTEKAVIISWLLDLDDVSFKEELKGFAEAKEWKKFAIA